MMEDSDGASQEEEEAPPASSLPFCDGQCLAERRTRSRELQKTGKSMLFLIGLFYTFIKHIKRHREFFAHSTLLIIGFRCFSLVSFDFPFIPFC
jgi:hypothetical protein